MGTRLAVAAVALCALLAPCAAAPVFDPGGFSVDFRGAGETAVTGDEMLPNGDMEALDGAGRLARWETDSYVWLPVSDPAAQSRMLERIRPLMVYESSDVSPRTGGRAMHLAMPLSAYSPTDPAGHEFCAMYHQAVELPSISDPTKYVLRFHYRGWSAPDVPNSRPYARLTFLDASRQPTRVYAQSIVKATDKWRLAELEAVAPPATRRLDVRLALTGPGEVFYDDVSLRLSAAQEQGPTVRLMPGAYVDNLYCLSSGDAETLCFGFRNESSLVLDRPQLLLRLPAGVEVLDTAPETQILEQVAVHSDGEALVQYRLDLAAVKGRIRDGTFPYPHNQWDGLQLVVRTALPPAEDRLRATYWLEDGTYRSEPLAFNMQIVPPIPTVTGPKALRVGAHLFLVTGIRRPEAVQAFSKLYQQVGLNCVHTPACPMGAELGKLGIERYAQPFANGYTMGDASPGGKPEDAVFRDVDGKAIWEAICPTEVYRRGPYFTGKIVGETLQGILVRDRTAEQLMCNWEPFMYVGKGCFCDRCKGEFAQYGHLSAEELDGIWPREVVAKHGKLWTAFRAWQHGRMMVTIEQEVSRLGEETGHETHFIPEVFYGLLTAGWEKDTGNAEYAAAQYMDELPVMNAWAPYNWFIFGRGPYEYIRGQHLNIHATASEVQRFVASRQPAGKRTRLIAFPYGTYEGATQPEALTMEMLTYLLDGYEGALAYLFPGGYDARYWRALAEMNRQLGMVEPYLLSGATAARHSVASRTPIPEPDPRFLDKCAPMDDPQRYEDMSLLQSWEFACGDSRLIAIGNFWQRGESFYRLTVDGLKVGERYILREPTAARVIAAPSGRHAWTAEELRGGALLHVGAMRVSWLLVEAYRDGVEYGEVVTQDSVASTMADRLAGIAQACQE